ncbi:MAG: PASTA domain-containing protein [Proteobacteria bacterium]|nr:PASTA domain-containing protein [Pseudomonadota bacterium]
MKNFTAKLFLVVLSIFVLHICVVEMSFAQSSGPVKTMPNLIGMTRQQAEAVLKQAGVSNYRVGFKETSDQNQDEKVFTQEPAAGKPLPAPGINPLAPSVNFTFYLNRNVPVSVPNVVGLSDAEAGRVLSNVYLSGQTVSPGVPTKDKSLYNMIASQNPVAGAKASKYTAVSLKLYKYDAPALVAVPDLTNMNDTQAWRTLDRLTLKYFVVRPEVPTTNKDLVLKVAKQDPPAGATVPRDSQVKVTFYVWDTKNTVEVPYVTRENFYLAKSDLEQRGLKVATGPEVSTSDATLDGKVVGQDLPSKDGQYTRYPKGTTVTLTVYRFKPPSGTPVPSVIGMDSVEANRTLQKAGLNLRGKGARLTTDRQQHMKVAGQDPLPGSNVPGGTFVSVEFWDASAVMQSAVPNVIGRRLPEADSAIKQTGLKTAVNYKPIEIQSNDGLVSSQDPQPGRMVTPGTTVTLTAYRFDPNLPVNVMWVTGGSLDEARKYLELVGLKVQVKGEQMTTDKSRVGKVAKQDPGSETQTPRVPRGSVVSLWIYREATAQVVVPNMVGLKIEDAKTALDKLTLKGSLTGYRAAMHQGSNMTVAAQTPGPGTSVPAGSVVSFEGYFYDPQKLPKVAVPKMVNTPSDQARTALANAGLQWSASYRGTTNKADDGKVAAQNPQPGSLVPQGSIIKLEIYQVQTKK